MRAKLEEISEKLTQLVDELREVFDVKEEELKTVLKVRISYKEIEIAEIKTKKTAKNLAKAFDVLQSILLMSDYIRKAFTLAKVLNLSIETSVRTLRIKHEFDVPRFKNFIEPRFASVATETLRKHARQKLDELEEISEVAKINYKNERSNSYEITLLNYNDLMQALNELIRIKEHYTEYKQAINATVQTVSRYIRAANKLTTKDNSEYLRHKKELRELEIRALEAGDYDNVSSETLKQFIKSTFTQFAYEKIKILDKSTTYRAVVFCTLERGAYNLLPARYYLCGEDDNGETWIHLVDNNDIGDLYFASYTEISSYYSYSVERAEARLLDVDETLFKNFIDRQGDVFIFKDERFIVKELHFVFKDAHESAYEQEIETDEFEILPNHVLKLEKTAKIRVTHERNKYYIDLPVPAVLEHPSHHHVELQPAKYIFVYIVSSNYQPVD